MALGLGELNECRTNAAAAQSIRRSITPIAPLRQ
jgi:hypothetical protein